MRKKIKNKYILSVLIFIVLLSMVILYIQNNQYTTVAFIGDQGLSNDSKAVLQLIKNENTNIVIHIGDLDYEDKPDAWAQQISNTLGDTPYITVLGNHELLKWNEYKKVIDSQISRLKDFKCTGENGVEFTCTYKDITFVFTTPGLTKQDHVTYIKDSLEKSTATWNICAWHLNQKTMQLGDKPDETGWEVYEQCKKDGAIIMTAHEHSYSRTHLLSDFIHQTIASTSTILQLEKGKTFAVVSGLGGKSIRPQKLHGPWWASTYTSDQKASAGALFCKFYSKKADCYFKDIKGNIPDRFEILPVKK